MGDSLLVEYYFLEGIYWFIMGYIEFKNFFYVGRVRNFINEMVDEFYLSVCFYYDVMVIWVVRVFVYCVIILILVLGNFMIIMVVWCNKIMWRIFYCFIVNLVVIDLIIMLVYMLWVIVIWLWGIDWLVEGIFGLVLCKIVFYFYGVSILVLILILLIFVIDRFFVIVFFLKLELFIVKLLKFVIVLIWVLGMFVWFFYFLLFKVIFYKFRGEFFCDVNMKRIFKIGNVWEIYYMFLLIVFYVFFFVFIIVLYIVIVIILWWYKMFFDKEIVKLV